MEWGVRKSRYFVDQDAIDLSTDIILSLLVALSRGLEGVQFEIHLVGIVILFAGEFDAVIAQNHI